MMVLKVPWCGIMLGTADAGADLHEAVVPWLCEGADFTLYMVTIIEIYSVKSAVRRGTRGQ
jgi:hypothetical protein